MINRGDMEGLEDVLLQREDAEAVGVGRLLDVLVKNLAGCNHASCIILDSLLRHEILSEEDGAKMSEYISINIAQVSEPNFFELCQFVVSRLDQHSLRLIEYLERSSTSVIGDERLSSAVSMFRRSWSQFNDGQDLPTEIRDLFDKLGYEID